MKVGWKLPEKKVCILKSKLFVFGAAPHPIFAIESLSELGHANQKTGFNFSPPPLLSVIWKTIKKIGKNRFPCSKPYEMDNYVKKKFKTGTPTHPPLSLLRLSGFSGAYSGYLGSKGRWSQPLGNCFVTKKDTYLYPGYQDSPMLVLTTWDHLGNGTNLLGNFLRPKKVPERLVPLLRTIYRVSRKTLATFVFWISRLPRGLEIPYWTFFNSPFPVDFKNIYFFIIRWNMDRDISKIWLGGQNFLCIVSWSSSTLMRSYELHKLS